MTEQQLGQLSPYYQTALEKAVLAEPNMTFARHQELERTATALGEDFDQDEPDQYKENL